MRFFYFWGMSLEWHLTKLNKCVGDFGGSGEADLPSSLKESNTHYSEKHLTSSWPQLCGAGGTLVLRSCFRRKYPKTASLQLQSRLPQSFMDDVLKCLWAEEKPTRSHFKPSTTTSWLKFENLQIFKPGEYLTECDVDGVEKSHKPLKRSLTSELVGVETHSGMVSLN